MSCLGVLYSTTSYNNFPSAKTMEYVRLLLTRFLELLLPICGGDSLAAEYLLLWMMSGLNRSNEPEVVGRFSLCLCNYGSPDDLGTGENVFDTVSQLLPRCQYMDLSIESLSSKPFAPYKDYESNRYDCKSTCPRRMLVRVTKV